jgi:DNA-directed RNA polymerase sigma subunit (sigma70/sigma32)
MTLREVAERIGVSFARIKQIETKALQKLKKNPITSSLLF